jgi:hypothetical protein
MKEVQERHYPSVFKQSWKRLVKACRMRVEVTILTWAGVIESKWLARLTMVLLLPQ